MIRAVLFDLDGVIRHFDPARVADIEIRHGVPAGAIESVAFAAPLIEEVTTGRISRAEWIAQIGRHLGDARAAIEWGAQPFRIDPAAVALADELRGLGLAAAILTNGTDTIPDEAARSGLDAHFDAIFNSAEIGYAKPDERAFAAALSRLGQLPEHVFFTDDSAAKLVGAASLGMTTHRFESVPRLRFALRDLGVEVSVDPVEEDPVVPEDR